MARATTRASHTCFDGRLHAHFCTLQPFILMREASAGGRKWQHELNASHGRTNTQKLHAGSDKVAQCRERDKFVLPVGASQWTPLALTHPCRAKAQATQGVSVVISGVRCSHVLLLRTRPSNLARRFATAGVIVSGVYCVWLRLPPKKEAK